MIYDDLIKKNNMKNVSGRTHTKQQLDSYSNQNNPNNKAYKANQANTARQKTQAKRREIGKKELMKYINELMCGETFEFTDLSKEDGVCIVKTAGKGKRRTLLIVPNAELR